LSTFELYFWDFVKVLIIHIVDKNTSK